MKKGFLVLGLLAISGFLNAQDKIVKDLKAGSERTIKKDSDTSGRVWRKGGIYGINISQGSLSNWAAGGDDFSFSVNSVLNLYAFYKKEKHSWDNTLDFNLGYVNTTSLGSRKNDDRIDVLSKYGYAISEKLNIAGLVNFRSQFFKGYTYENDNKNLISNFLAPAYALVSPGIDYKPNSNLSIFISPATSRWTIVKDNALSAIGAYGVEPGKHFANEIGAFATVNYLKSFSENVTYKGRLDLFSNYKGNAKNVDLFMTNVLNFKISKALSATYSLDMIYDDDVKMFGKNGNSPRLQVKSLIGIGLLVKF